MPGVETYLTFHGNCADAMRFYEKTLGAKIEFMMTHGESPMADKAPPDFRDKVMHGSMTIGDQVLMAADVAPEGYEEPKGISLSLQMNDTSEAERVFNELAKGGRIVLPLEKTFWAARFGMLVDRFGIPWLINCDGSDEERA